MEKHNTTRRIEGSSEQNKKNIEFLFKERHSNLIFWCKNFLIDKGFSRANAGSVAEDLVTKLYEQLLNAKDLPDFSAPDFLVDPFLNIALKRVVVNYLRDENNTERTPSYPGVLSYEKQAAQDFTQKLKTMELKEAMEKLEKIDPELAKVMRMRFVEGLTLLEVAAEFGIEGSETAQKSVVYRKELRAKEILNEMLKTKNSK